MEFRKARVNEILDDPRYDPPITRRNAGHIARSEWEMAKIPQKIVTNKENGDKKAEKEKTPYMLFRNQRVTELLKENPEMTKRDAGALAKTEWKEKNTDETKKRERTPYMQFLMNLTKLVFEQENNFGFSKKKQCRTFGKSLWNNNGVKSMDDEELTENIFNNLSTLVENYKKECPTVFAA